MITHIGFFSIQGHDRVDDGPRKGMSDQEARNKKEAEKVELDEKKLEDKEKETEVEKMEKVTKKEMYDEKAHRKEEIKKSVLTKDNGRSIKEQTWKTLGKDKLTCKDGVTNLLQFLDEKLSIRAAEPEEQTGKAFNGRKFEKLQVCS